MSMILRVSMHVYHCQNGVYEFTCTIPTALALTMKAVSDIGNSAMALTTLTTYFCSLIFACSTLSSVMLVSLVVARLSTDTSYTITTGPSCNLQGSVILSARRITFTNLSMNYVPRKRRTLHWCCYRARYVRRLLQWIHLALLCRWLPIFFLRTYQSRSITHVDWALPVDYDHVLT